MGLLRCQASREAVCSQCHQSKPRTSIPKRRRAKEEGGSWLCEACRDKFHRAMCKQCKESKALSSFSLQTRSHRKADWRCLECQFPSCTRCQRPWPREKGPWQRDRAVYVCDSCLATSLL